MKSLIVVSALLHLAALSSAFNASIFFMGAGSNPQSYFQEFPTDDTLHAINNPLSVAKISSDGGAICNFFGIDGSDTFVHDEETVVVGPPQVQVSGVCDTA